MGSNCFKVGKRVDKSDIEKKCCSVCGIKLIDNPLLFHKKPLSYCIECHRKKNQKRLNKIKKRNIWNL